jgi:NADPH2:quinone reductase
MVCRRDESARTAGAVALQQARDRLSFLGRAVRAARAHRHGPPNVIEVEDVAPALVLPGTARVAVDTAAVNFPDILVLAGRYQVKVPVPYTPGCEFAGTVIEIAEDVGSVRVGDRVIGLATHGAFAEEVVLEEWRLMVVPETVDRFAAAAFGVTYTTAYHALNTLGTLKPGQWVVVLGAAGGVGMAAIDVARALGGRVIAGASSEEKLAACRDIGAEATINYTAEDLKARIKEVTGTGADVVVDPVGGPFSEPALRAMRWGGRFVVVGFASGEIPSIPLNLILLKGIILTGFENRTILQHLPDVAPAHRREVVRLLAEGRLHPHVGAVYPLERVGRALEEVADRRAIGKVVIDVSGERG